jgi:hypothetical protein
MNWCVEVELALKGSVYMDVSNRQKITFMSTVVRSVTVLQCNKINSTWTKYTDFKGIILGVI